MADEGPSPGPWAAGQVECITFIGGRHAVEWTDNAKLRFGNVQSSDIASLYQWWSSKHG
jgi:hypothetical protein